MSEAEPNPNEPEPTPPPPEAAPQPEPPKGDPPPEPKPNGNGKDPIAAGGDPAPDPEPEKYWPDDWRKKFAEHYAAGDEKAYERELKRLARIKDPSAVFGSYRELEAWRDKGGFIKKPGEDATDEEKTEFAKTLGWPDSPEEMIDQIKLENDAVLGEVDKPVVEEFLKAVHGATSAQEFTNKAANWYLGVQEKQAAELDERDDTHKRNTESTLKGEWGGAFDRKRNSISTLFQSAPGGTRLVDDDGNPSNSLYNRLMSGRMGDGTIIGDDPDFIRWIVGVTDEVNPSATLIEGGEPTVAGVKQRLDAIREVMRTDRQRYNKDPSMQAEYRELLAAEEKMLSRQQR